MNSITEHNPAEYIDKNLSAHLFGRLDRVTEAALTRDFGVIAAWNRRTWFRGNRAVVLVPLPDSINHPGKFAQGIKLPLGKSIVEPTAPSACVSSGVFAFAGSCTTR